MKTSYVATDLELYSFQDLGQLVAEFSDRVSVNLNQWVDDVYRVAVGIGFADETPEVAVAGYCTSIEQLSERGRTLWVGCSHRAVDIAFESGTEPHCYTHELSMGLVHRLSKLELAVRVTIYRLGAYSDL